MSAAHRSRRHRSWTRADSSVTIHGDRSNLNRHPLVLLPLRTPAGSPGTRSSRPADTAGHATACVQPPPDGAMPTRPTGFGPAPSTRIRTVPNDRRTVMSKVIVITGAGSGFGALSARHLADAGYTVYAGIRETTGRNAGRVQDARDFADQHGVDLRAVELDIASQASCDAGIARIIEESGRLDVVLHNAGHMVLGPLEAYTPEELTHVYDVNVLGTQRVNRAALPHLRKQGHGLLLWVGSTSTRGGTPPYLAPYFAAKAGMDALAVSYAAELARFGIETTIVVPGSFTSGTNHFAHSGRPADDAVVAEYEALYPSLMEQV